MTRKRHRLTRAATERMLDDLAHGAASSRHHPVGDLLSSVVPHPFPGEAPGEWAAVAAFRATRDAAAITATPRPRVARLATLKIAAAAMVLAAGAVAATVARTAIHPSGGTAGAHPSPVRAEPPKGPLPAVTAGPARSSDAPAPASTTPASAAMSTHPASPPRSTDPQPQASTPLELCQAYVQMPPGKQRKALDTPAFAPLVRAAGATPVDRYCAALLDGANTDSHQGGPTVRPSRASASARMTHGRVTKAP